MPVLPDHGVTGNAVPYTDCFITLPHSHLHGLETVAHFLQHSAWIVQYLVQTCNFLHQRRGTAAKALPRLLPANVSVMQNMGILPFPINGLKLSRNHYPHEFVYSGSSIPSILCILHADTHTCSMSWPCLDNRKPAQQNITF